jgi:AcrR family transcriptional regulator
MVSKKQSKLHAIYDAALKAFARFGYRKATMEDIAAAAGMTKGNLYLYVKDKRDLYEKSVAHGLLRWQGRVREEISREEDVEKQFLLLGAKAYEYLAEDDNLRAILIDDPSIFPLSPSEDRFEHINNESISMLKSVLEKGIAENRFAAIDVDYTARFLFSIYVMFIIKTYVKSEGSSTGRMFQEGLQVILRGLLKR